MGSPESRRRTAGATIPTLLESVANIRIFHCEGRLDQGLSSKSVPLPLKRANQRLTVLMGALFSLSTLLMFRRAPVADCLGATHRRRWLEGALWN